MNYITYGTLRVKISSGDSQIRLSPNNSFSFYFKEKYYIIVISDELPGTIPECRLVDAEHVFQLSGLDITIILQMAVNNLPVKIELKEEIDKKLTIINITAPDTPS
jgi:hypothetical protein